MTLLVGEPGLAPAQPGLEMVGGRRHEAAYRAGGNNGVGHARMVSGTMITYSRCVPVDLAVRSPASGVETMEQGPLESEHRKSRHERRQSEQSRVGRMPF
jgi:hypothetical protein